MLAWLVTARKARPRRAVGGGLRRVGVAPALVHRESRRWAEQAVLVIGSDLDVPRGARVRDPQRELPDAGGRAVHLREAWNRDVEVPRLDRDLGCVCVPLGGQGGVIRIRTGSLLYRKLARL